MKKEKRFEVLSDESIGGMKGAFILRDKHTGVQYLFVMNGYGGGLTPLLDKGGSPIIDECAK